MNSLEKLYKELKKKYGLAKGQWRLWCKRLKTGKEREEVVIGAILTQRTNWRNVEMALKNLKREKINSLRDIYKLGPEKLAPLIKSSGFYRAKANYLFHLAKFIIENYGSLREMKKEDLPKLRGELLKLKGIGKETADSILLYAIEKPVFVIDEYTRRFVKKHKMAKKFPYEYLQNLFQKSLPRDIKIYQDLHAMIVLEEKGAGWDSKNPSEQKII